MGYAIAAACIQHGAFVKLISGPVSIQPPDGLSEFTGVITASQMFEQCAKDFHEYDIIIMAAAVADYSPVQSSSQKIKKKSESIVLELRPTKDILRYMGDNKKPEQILVGFALETENEEVHAKEKLHNKNLDMIVLNSLSDKGAGFGTDTNIITMFDKNGRVFKGNLKSKQQVAVDIVNAITEIIDYKDKSYNN